GGGMARGMEPINLGERMEDVFSPLRLLVISPPRQADRAERDLRASIGPSRTGVGNVITRLRHLDEDAESRWLLGQPLADLVKQKVLGLGSRDFIGKVFGPGFWSYAKPPMAA